VDVRAGELRKHGIPIRLPDQSFQLLSMLLECPGEVVLRGDIRLRLWPNDTVVDFDQSISAAMRRLRSALGESADSPRYIETVAKRGYRFRGELENPAAAPEALRTPPRYRLIEKLGQGGMGVVYRAEDLRLGRQVAVKLLLGTDGGIPQRAVARLEREARTASCLNHPNICTIYGLDTFPDGPGIVMELLSGETLAARLARGRLPLLEALEIAIQVTAALAEAHAAGVVHRDLKPANVMLTRNGVKVLDFGLAQTGPAQPVSDASTADGEPCGTLPYMSPEQIEGGAVDAASDLFCLGLVIYEMLGGGRPFAAATARGLKTAILEREPAKLKDVPPAVAAFVDRCLAKDPAARWPSAGAAREELERLAREAGAGAERRGAPRRMTLLWPGAAMALAVAAFVLFRWVAHPFEARVEVARVLRLTGTGDLDSANISPDGRYVAYVNNTNGHDVLWLKQTGAETGVRLLDFGEETCGGVAFSPDAQSLFFTRKPIHDPNGALYRIALPGGAPEFILGGISGQPFLSPDGQRVAFVRSTRSSGGEDALIVDAVSGGSQRELVRYSPPGIHHNQLAWTSDGRRIAYIAMGRLTAMDLAAGVARPLPDQNWVDPEDVATSPYGADEILTAATRPGVLGPYQLFRVSLDRNWTRQLTHEDVRYRRARPTADGRWILALADESPRTVHVLTFDGRVTDRVAIGDKQIKAGQGGLAWTPEGRILFASRSYDEDHGDLWVVEADGSNRRRLTQSPADSYLASPAMAAQGQEVAFTVWTVFDRAHLSLMDVSNGGVRQLTWGVQDDSPAFSPDGTWVVYKAVRSNMPVLMRVPAKGGPSTLLTDYPANRPAVSPDGKWIACFGSPERQGATELVILPSAGGAPAKVFPLPKTAKQDVRPVWTPDGTAISYVNRVDGASNVWNQPIAGGLPKPVTGFKAQDIYNFDWSRDNRLVVSLGVDNTDAMLLQVERRFP
jgi:Tol biopolymer transport system component/DNA-binding winged helix-turn-helix (wHTH) protein